MRNDSLNQNAAGKTYYLYRHIRHDLNVPFYIGVSSKNNPESFSLDRDTYYRAFARGRGKVRNPVWAKIVSLTSYDVEILYETTDKGLIQEKEVEFINLYGKIIDNTGTLANIETGGFNSKKHKASVQKRSKQVFVYKKSGEFYTTFLNTKDAEDVLDTKTSIANAIKYRKGSTQFYYFYRTYKGDKVLPFDLNNKRTGYPVIVENFERGIRKEYVSLCVAAKDNKISFGTAQRRLNDGQIFRGYQFKFKFNK